MIAFRTSDLRNIVVPIDRIGRRCGREIEIQKKPDAHYFDLLKCISFRALFYGCSTNVLCSKKCPNKKFVFDLQECVKVTHEKYIDKVICGHNQPLPDDGKCLTIEEYIKKDMCAAFHFPSESSKCVVNRFYFKRVTFHRK